MVTASPALPTPSAPESTPHFRRRGCGHQQAPPSLVSTSSSCLASRVSAWRPPGGFHLPVSYLSEKCVWDSDSMWVKCVFFSVRIKEGGDNRVCEWVCVTWSVQCRDDHGGGGMSRDEGLRGGGRRDQLRALRGCDDQTRCRERRIKI